VPVLDGLLLPAAFGTSRDRVLTVVAYEVGSGLGHVHEDAGEKIAGVEGLEYLIGARYGVTQFPEVIPIV
jgi:hypothetical protein